MQPDPMTEALAELLTACFNGSPASSIAHLCDRSLMINSFLMGGDRRLNALATAQLPTLLQAVRTRFPDTRFRSHDLSTTEQGFTFGLSGELASAAAGRALPIECTCRVRLAQEKISELWFQIDEYRLLLEQGRICSAPGESVEASRTANERAAEALSQLLRTRTASAEGLDADTNVHVNIELYKDLSKGLITETRRFDGAGTAALDEALQLLRGRFQDPVELSFGKGISQGSTTTFRGKIRARVGPNKQRYNIVCGFTSPIDRVTECWICITPPPTLMECLA